MLLTCNEIKEYIQQGLLVQHYIDLDTQLQPCGFDVTVAKVFSFKGLGTLDFTNEKRVLPEYVEIKPTNNTWILEPGVYHFAMNERIVLPKNIAGLLLPRSSALCCGLEVHSALWDPGYEGRSFMHVNVTRKVKLHLNARVAQMIFIKLEGEAEYKGRYKFEDLLKFAKRGSVHESRKS